MNLRWTALAALLISLAIGHGQKCLAVDISKPGIIHFTVRDEAGNPIAGVAVTLTGTPIHFLDPGATILKKITDADGKAEFSRVAEIGGPVEWGEMVDIQKDGYEKNADYISSFVGADIQKDEVLAKKDLRTTLIHIVGPDGRPAPAVHLQINWTMDAKPRPYSEINSAWADDNGVYQWSHPKLQNGFTVVVGDSNNVSPDEGDITVKLTPADFAGTGSGTLLRGKLLTPQGRPAVGWLVGQHCAFSYAMGMANAPSTTDCYSVGRLVTVGADGSFSLRGDSQLLLVSPEGVSLLYGLNPQTWHNNERHITVTVPEVRRTLHGTLFDENGKPLAHIPFTAEDTLSHKGQWNYSVRSDIPQEIIAPRFATDANGQFTFPQYFGTSGVAYSFGEAGPSWVPGNDEGPTAQVVYKPTTYSAPESLKDITIAFVDTTGKLIDDSLEPGVTAYVGDRPVFPGGNSNIDGRGSHYFIDSNAVRIDIRARSVQWRPFKQTFTLTGNANQRIEIKFEPEQRYLPVTGRVLDFRGKPVVGANISVYPESGPDNVASDDEPNFFGDGIVTDDQGRFTLSGAPDTCKLTVTKYQRGSSIRYADPGMDPVSITKDLRDLQITLPPAGSIRILLPEGIDLKPDPNAPMRSISALEEQSRHNGIFAIFEYDSTANTLVALGARVGVYRFAKDGLKELGDVSAIPIAVKEGAETVVDWRTLQVPPAEKKVERWVIVIASANGAPASGAEVSVYTPSGWQAGALESITSDLSDDDGTIRFKGTLGGEYVAVARERGKLLGWQKFNVGASEDEKVQMKPTRTLEFQLPETDNAPANGGPGFAATVELLELTGIERDSLIMDSARTGWMTNVATPGKTLAMLPDSKRDFVLEDIPIGTHCYVQVSNFFDRATIREFDVTVEPGNGPQEIIPSATSNH